MLICKTHDYIHHYHGCWRSGGICRIEIFQEEGRPPVIICTELPAHDNTSITLMAECLAAEVALEHFPAAFEEIGEPFVWIEHHPAIPKGGLPAVYLWVTFDSYPPRQIQHRIARRPPSNPGVRSSSPAGAAPKRASWRHSGVRPPRKRRSAMHSHRVHDDHPTSMRRLGAETRRLHGERRERVRVGWAREGGLKATASRRGRATHLRWVPRGSPG
jgi:hypothetical protein